MSMNPLHNYDQWKAGDYSATVDEWEDWAERIVAAFRAELNAAKKDFDQIGQLLLEQDTLKAERDEAVKAYADECATNVYLRDDYAALKRALEGERKVARHHASVINTARRLCNEGDEQIAALKRENAALRDVIDNAIIAYNRCDARTVPDKGEIVPLDAVMVWSVAWQEIEDALLTEQDDET